MSNGPISNGVFTSANDQPAINATSEGAGDGIDASATAGTGLQANSQTGAGVLASSFSGPGLVASSSNGTGLVASTESTNGIGLWAIGGGVSADEPPDVQAAVVAQGSSGYGVFTSTSNGVAVFAGDDGSGTGVQAGSFSGNAVLAASVNGMCLHAVGAGQTPVTPPGALPTIYVQGVNDGASAILIASSTATCITAISDDSSCLIAETGAGPAISGSTTTGAGVTGSSSNSAGVGVSGTNPYGPGVTGSSLANPVLPGSGSGTGVEGTSDSGIGVMGTTQSIGGTGVVADGGTAPDGSPLGAVALQVQNGTIAVTSDSVGTVTMTAGSKTLTKLNAAATANSLIFLTPLGNPQAFLWISARSAGSFTIEASTALAHNINIGFLIIN